jgi:tetratricopeptide (TPR) repeat protein
LELPCNRVWRNLTVYEWNEFLGADIPYERTCPKLPVHPSFIVAGRNRAKEGDIAGAIAIFQRALELDPALKLNPKAEANGWVAKGLVAKGEQLARQGRVKEAITAFTKAKELDPTLELDSRNEASRLAAPKWVAEGEQLAKQGKVEEAITAFTKAKELDPTLELDPRTETGSLAAAKLVAKGEQLAKQGKIKEALAAYDEAKKRYPALSISAKSLNNLCWSGCLWGHAAEVMNACEQAVATDPEHGGIQDSRGLARALTGDTEGAIEDFQAFILWTDNEEMKSQRQRWIDALNAGGNPFTPEVLEKLRSP